MKYWIESFMQIYFIDYTRKYRKITNKGIKLPLLYL